MESKTSIDNYEITYVDLGAVRLLAKLSKFKEGDTFLELTLDKHKH